MTRALTVLPLCAALLLLAAPAGAQALSATAADDRGERWRSPESGPAGADVEPTLEAIFRPPRLLGQRPDDVGVSADGRWVTFSWTPTDAVVPERDVWLAATDGSVRRVLFEHGEKAAVRWSRTGALLLVEKDGWISVLDVDAGTPPRPLLQARGLSGATLLDDGRRLVLQSGPEHQVWVVDLLDGRRVTPAAHLTGRSSWMAVLQDAGLLALLADGPRASVASPPAPDGGGTAPGAAPASLSPAISDPEHDGDGAHERGRHLWLVPLDGSDPGRPVALPADGDLWPSPDGRWVARRHVQREAPRSLVMADYLTPAVSTISVRSGLAGDPAPRVALSLHDTRGERTVHPPLQPTDRFHLRHTDWSPDGRLLLVERISDDHHVREVLVVDPEAGAAWPVHVEHDPAWIGGPYTFAGWSHDGQLVLFTSEHSGWNHLYRVAPEGGEPVALTAGRREVHWVHRLPDDGRLLVVATTEDDPTVRALEVLDEGGELSLQLTAGSGCVVGIGGGPSADVTRPLVSADGSTVVYGWEPLGVPADLFAQALPRAADGRLSAGAAVRLTDTVPPELAALALRQPEIVDYPSPGGEGGGDVVPVRALLYRPEPFDPQQSYPAVLFVHGAGQLQNVTRSSTFYDRDKLFHHRLARRGYVVLAPDFRHSEGYGRDFRAAVHGHMGGPDADDLVAGVEYLRSLGFVDAGRVGLYGGSYGGFLTLMALFTQPEVFACGAALRSVTDWRSYHPAYTNPRLGHPVHDAEAYARSSPIDHVAGLQRPLLVLHGMKDDNVFAQDSIRLLEKLIELGKDFDAMLYPSQGHGFTDPASWIDEYRRIERFFDRHLQGRG